jgi:hypothetical protein
MFQDIKGFIEKWSRGHGGTVLQLKNKPRLNKREG